MTDTVKSSRLGSLALPEQTSHVGIQDYWMRPVNLLRRAQRLSLSLFAEECGDLDISRTQFEAMIVIEAKPGLDQISLARACGMDRSTTTQALQVLEERGLVVRSRRKDDGRKHVLELTPAGEATLDGARAAARRAEARLLLPLTDAEVDRFFAALATFATEVPSSAPEWAAAGPSANRSAAFLLRRSVQVAFALFAAVTADLDITPTQFGPLFLLKVVQMDEAALSRRSGVDRSTSDRLLKRLMARGYIERTKRRDRPVLQLTPLGERMFHEVRARTEQVDGRVLSALAPAARDDFMEIISKLMFVHG
jgi:DNA-binding MarR family transcriptional regulator